MPCLSSQFLSRRMLAVGKPRSRPRFSPWITVAGDEPGPAQHAGGVGNLALGERHADGSGRDRPLVDIDMGLHVDLDAELGRLGNQEARRADAALAEMEVVADRNAADAEPPDEVMVNKILRRGAGADLVESHHHGARKTHTRQQPELVGLGGQAELRAVRAEKTAWMRLERHGEGGPAARLAHAQRRPDHGAMAEMDAVEIAHRHHRPPGDRGSGRGVADNGKFGRHSRGFWVDSGGFPAHQGRGRTVAWPDGTSQAGRIVQQNGCFTDLRAKVGLTPCLTPRC